VCESFVYLWVVLQEHLQLRDLRQSAALCCIFCAVPVCLQQHRKSCSRTKVISTIIKLSQASGRYCKAPSSVSSIPCQVQEGQLAQQQVWQQGM
jgi:hypothetical protein